MTQASAWKGAVSDRHAFETMYTEMAPKVYRYCTSRLGVPDGEEVTAETFQAAVKAYTDGRAEVLTPAWVMTVARNKVIDRWRAIERRRVFTHLYAHTTAARTSTSEPEVDPRREWVATTLDRLTPRHRMLLVMQYVEGMRAAEIADALDTSLSSVESAMARARESFRRNYREVKTA